MESSQSLNTYAALIQSAAATLATASEYGTWPQDEVRHQTQAEAEQMVCHLTAWSRLQLLQHLRDTVPAADVAQMQTLVTARQSGIPLAYVLSEAYFYGRVFRTRAGSLIPRPDTETLVACATDWLRTTRPDATIVDVGTGTGCIAITLALECPAAQVYAVDISSDAIQLAMENANALHATVQLVHADGLRWLQNEAKQHLRVNVIISNPPYIKTQDIQTLDASVRLYEPHLALDGGADGLDFYRAFAQQCSAVLADGPAAVFLEVGQGQAVAVANLFAESAAWQTFQVKVHNDLRNVQRVVAITRGNE